MSAPKHWDSLQKLHSLPPNEESDLKLAINSPMGLVTLWVLVEGNADPYFYERMFNMTWSKVVKVGKKGKDGKLYGGNKVVMELVNNLLNLGLTQRIIGIIDRDWRPFKKDNRKPLPKNIFETDLRDLEMTFLSISALRNALGQEIVSTMKPDHKKWFKNGHWYKKCGDWYRDIWEQCCMVSRYMGSLRIVDSHFELPRIDFIAHDCWDEKQHVLYNGWENRLFHIAEKQSGCCHFRLLVYCWMIRYKYDINHRSVYDVCRGHDFLSLLSEMLIDKSHYSEMWMTFFMTKEISVADIRNMCLYQNIDRWTTTTGVTMMAH